MSAKYVFHDSSFSATPPSFASLPYPHQDKQCIYRNPLGTEMASSGALLHGASLHEGALLGGPEVRSAKGFFFPSIFNWPLDSAEYS